MAYKREAVNKIEALLAIDDLMDDIVSIVADNYKPEEVFVEEQLSTWAENNGYTKE